MDKLNIGCGKYPLKGYLNLDIVKLPGVDVVHSLDKYPWPFKNNQFQEVNARHVLEHLESGLKPMEEIWRISKNKAEINIEVPLAPGPQAFVDPTHKQFYTFLTFDYFLDEKPEMNYYTKARFSMTSRHLIFGNKLFTWLFNVSESMQKFHFVFLSNIIPAHAMQVKLIVKKN
jgi:SAM-dependent methyltransferase